MEKRNASFPTARSFKLVGQPPRSNVHHHHHCVYTPDDDFEADDHAIEVDARTEPNTVLSLKIASNTVILPPKPDEEEVVKSDHAGEDVSDKRTFTVFLNGKPLGRY